MIGNEIRFPIKNLMAPSNTTLADGTGNREGTVALVCYFTNRPGQFEPNLTSFTLRTHFTGRIVNRISTAARTNRMQMRKANAGPGAGGSKPGGIGGENGICTCHHQSKRYGGTQACQCTMRVSHGRSVLGRCG